VLERVVTGIILQIECRCSLGLLRPTVFLVKNALQINNHKNLQSAMAAVSPGARRPACEADEIHTHINLPKS